MTSRRAELYAPFPVLCNFSFHVPASLVALVDASIAKR